MSWTALIPYAFQIISFLLKRVDANVETIKAFQNLVDKSTAQGLISVQASDKFASMHEELMAKFKAPPP